MGYQIRRNLLSYVFYCYDNGRDKMFSLEGKFNGRIKWVEQRLKIL